MELFNSQDFGVGVKLRMGSAVVRLAATKNITRSLPLCRKYAGCLLNSIRCIKSNPLQTQDDLGKGLSYPEH